REIFGKDFCRVPAVARANRIRRDGSRPGRVPSHHRSPWGDHYGQKQAGRGRHFRHHVAGASIATASYSMSAGPKTNVILMADDDADDRLLAKDAFFESQLNGDLHFVENGEELLDYLLHRGKYDGNGAAPRPRLILLDLNMPRKDGREALREI